jgi:hypothetical protein
MRKTLLIATAMALVAVPGGALAAKPVHPATPANGNANSHANGSSTTGSSSNAGSNAQGVKVMFVIRGTLGAYAAASGTTKGSIVITVKSSNQQSSSLKGLALTFPVSSTSKVVGTVKSGDDGIVKVRAAKSSSAATLQTLTAFQLIDQGASS